MCVVRPILNRAKSKVSDGAKAVFASYQHVIDGLRQKNESILLSR